MIPTKMPDVIIKLESSVFSNPLFTKPDAPQSEPANETLPASTVIFENPTNQGVVILDPKANN